jgi:hypothetical protein
MRLVQMQLAAANCQVALVVPDAEEEPPLWSTGQELVVANSAAIYVSALCDVDGEVEVEVWMAEELPHQHAEPIYDGTVSVRNAGVLVGSYTGNHLGHLPLLRAGDHRVRVYTTPPGPEAEHICFVID